jgi:rubrerythrin
MDVEMKGYEILEIAERIEQNGVKFYRRAAGLCDDARASALFVELAHWEVCHIEIFRKMKERWADDNWQLGDLSPDPVGRSDSQLLAGMAVFAIQPDPAAQLTKGESRNDVLKMAIEKEKESVVYYSGLKGFVPHEGDRKIIDNIIQEEMKHVRILTQALGQQD